MKPKIIRTIIILMSISLIGIVCVQVFWIMNAVKINEEQFGRKVNDALSELVNKIETDETSQIIKGNICAIDVGDKATVGCGNADTDICQYKTKVKKIILSGQDYSDSSCSGIKIMKNEKIFSFGKNNNGKSETVVNTTISLSDDTSKSVCVTVINNNKVDVKTDKFRNVVEKMIVEYESKNIPLNCRLKQIDFTDILKSVLKNHALELPYEFIVSSNNKKDSAIVSNGFKENSRECMFTVNLFPNDLVKKSDYIKLYFPGRSGYIYQSLSLMIIGSIIFTFIILLTFIITIFTILRQKKISEIKNDFINNMTHEFKTPIATISLASDSIINPIVLENKEQIQYFSRIIKEESLRMNTKVESVLQLSLFDKNEIEFHISTVSVHEQIEKAIEKIKLQVEQKNGQITTELKASKDKVEADSEHFLGALLNVLDNALKYSAEIPVIHISTYNKNNTVCIAISDKGIGMDKEDTKRIFERFYRVHTGDVHNVKGFGLGLCYVKEIITACKGKISVQSTKGTGSTFTICLPLK
jgi:two-component system, OmpR family, phosphate regulon sensor histidine kinase PhoR